MSTVDERIEAALSALAADVGAADLAAARERITRRSAELRGVTVGDSAGAVRRWWLAAAAALVVVVGVVGIVALRGSDPDEPVSPPTPPSSSGPTVPEQVAVLAPDAGLGRPTRANPYMEWVSDRVETPSASYRREDGPGTISYTYGTDVAGPSSSDETTVELGDGVIGRRGEFPDVDGQYLVWSSGDVVYMVSWTSTVTDAEALEFVRSAIDEPAAPQPPTGMTATRYPHPIDTATATYRDGDVTVGFARYPTGQRPTAVEFAGQGDDDQRDAGRVVVGRTEFGEIAVIELDDDTLAWVATATDGLDVDAATLAEGVELVPAADVPYADGLDEHAVPTDANVVFGGEQPPMRWALATWTADDGQHCAALMAGTNLTPRCDTAPEPDCLFMTGGTTNGDTRYFAVVKGSPTSVVVTLDDGNELIPQLVAADAGYTFASGQLDDVASVDGITVDGDACTLM